MTVDTRCLPGWELTEPRPKPKLKAVSERVPPAPAYLRPETREWWTYVVSNWALDEHHVRLLTLAAEAYDRAAEAREALGEHGLTYKDKRFDAPRLRPEVAVERDSRIGFARLVRDLNLDEESPPSPLALRPYRKR